MSKAEERNIKKKRPSQKDKKKKEKKEGKEPTHSTHPASSLDNKYILII
jgi:hypothetical protein